MKPIYSVTPPPARDRFLAWARARFEPKCMLLIIEFSPVFIRTLCASACLYCRPGRCRCESLLHTLFNALFAINFNLIHSSLVKNRGRQACPLCFIPARSLRNAVKHHKNNVLRKFLNHPSWFLKRIKRLRPVMNLKR